MNGTDPDGRWFLVDDAIAAGIGAAVGLTTYSLKVALTSEKWSWSRAGVYTAIGAGSGWLAWNTGGASLAYASAQSGGLATNMGLWTAVGYGASSGAAGGAFAAGATYTEKATYGNSGYSLNNLQQNWSPEGFAKATVTGGVAGGLTGGAIAGMSWGISSYANNVNQERFSKPDDQLSEADRFVKKNGLAKGPLDRGWRSAGVDPQSDLAKQTLDGSVDRGSAYSNFMAKSGFCNGNACQRFEGGLHVTSDNLGNATGHFDFFDPSESVGQWLGHMLVEVPVGKGWVDYNVMSPVVSGIASQW